MEQIAMVKSVQGNGMAVVAAQRGTAVFAGGSAGGVFLAAYPAIGVGLGTGGLIAGRALRFRLRLGALLRRGLPFKIRAVLCFKLTVAQLFITCAMVRGAAIRADDDVVLGLQRLTAGNTVAAFKIEHE